MSALVSDKLGIANKSSVSEMADIAIKNHQNLESLEVQEKVLAYNIKEKQNKYFLQVNIF